MRKQITLISMLFAASTGSAAVCKLTYFSENTFQSNSQNSPEMREVSKTLNAALKKTVETIQTVDKYTLGLASAIATGGLPISKLRPEQWDKFYISGHVVYQDSPFASVSLRAAQIEFSSKDRSHKIRTGTFGEFSESFSKLIPYTHIRLFPHLIIEKGEKTVPLVQGPIQVKIESSVCTAETSFSEYPLEPLVFILRKAQ